MSQLNVSIPPALRSWIDHRVAEGRYSSASDLVRDLLRRDQESAADETEWLRALIAEGLASGISKEKPETIIDNIIAKRRARRG
ncbi:type II toxin-antitoxin system ParD family antitoxin [Allopontixanthobacter sp.]|uniref:type II toxin-antitoxin system ParD family antitoxin n=1 Tax=Allopontixanthobacter sp. TaxID=2906452 RepID=UPI002AB979F7|nr:type II toxin-antitoxin system ParD family antitoxin [Allopontixanthobacter sp.]MDZ4307684.1 type II toxin-antitoxin system ParD family antitoxin [Allopontixanthobacter sp.]